MTANFENKILKVKDLTVSINNHGVFTKVLDKVSFEVGKGEVFGLVGESGSGKTLSALSILRLLPSSCLVESGDMVFNGDSVLAMPLEYFRRIRGSKISMVFQEPSTSLNPVFTIGYQIKEAILAHRKVAAKEAAEQTIDLLRRVHIKDADRIYYGYPHQLSGGTKQRVMIAMALANSPDLLILDEPTTALDVTIQAQILDLLEDVIEAEKMAVLFISHDFGIISRMCDKVGVMCKGRIVETNGKSDILANPKNPYTVSLIDSVKALS